MNESHGLGIRIGIQCIGDFLWIDRLAPGVFDDHGCAAEALHVLDHAAAEDPVTADDDLVARLDEIDEASLHADRTRSGNGEGQRVLGLEGIAEENLDLLHHLDESRIEVADGRPAQCRNHARMHV